MQSPIRRFEQHVTLIDTPQSPFERLLVVNLFAHDHFRESPGEAAIVAGIPQRAVEARRRDLKRIGERQRVLDVENRANLTIHLLAVLDADTLVR